MTYSVDKNAQLREKNSRQTNHPNLSCCRVMVKHSFVFLYRHATNRPCLATAGYFCIVAWLRCAMERLIRTRRCLYPADHLAANVPEALTVCLTNTQLIDCGIVMWKYCETLGGWPQVNNRYVVFILTVYWPHTLYSWAYMRRPPVDIRQLKKWLIVLVFFTDTVKVYMLLYVKQRGYNNNDRYI